MKDLIIIGAGPAGLTAAIYALRAGATVSLIEGNVYGGQMSITSSIENYPGFRSVTGPELSSVMYKQVIDMGGEFVFQKAESVNLLGDVKIVKTSVREFNAKTVVIANGLKRRVLGCRGEKEFASRGVSYCATCDGAFFKGKKVFVVGGGNTAVEDALYLSNICKEVTLVVRKNYLRAERYLSDSLDRRSNINKFMQSRIREIKGDKIVESVVIEDKGGNCREIHIDGIFIAIGYEPDNKIYKNQIEMNENMYFISDESCVTNVPGVFVAGDCRLKPIRQIVTAVADGAVAGSMAIRFLSEIQR